MSTATQIDPRQALESRLREVQRWREVLQAAQRTIEQSDAINCTPESTVKRLVECKAKLVKQDELITSLKADIAELEKSPS